MTCPHIVSQDLHPPKISQSVYREDCTQCFDSIDSPKGLDVCLECFNGGCVGERQHSRLHHERTTHPLALNIKRKRKHVSREEPPQKMSKLAIAAETEADRYDYSTQINCLACGIQDIDKSEGNVAEVVNGIMEANTFARQEEVKAWEQEITPCEHTLCMEQQPALKIASQSLGKCSACDLKENLWLCLVCGALGCGRAQYGGVGGNSHALAHSKETGHGVAVKLGSLTADGTADVYCYLCNDEKIDPELATHLSHWGINISDRVKTEKSLTEMQIEQNLRWEFSMTTEDGKEMTPLFGPGFTGLKNLGNSCYLASIVQCLFQFPEFIERYYHPGSTPVPTLIPAEDLETQLRKIADGLVSGRYSHPDPDVTQTDASHQIPHQKGLAPAMLKALIGRGHAEFSTMRQQDAFEFLLHLLQLISRSKHDTALPDPVSSFGFCMEQRLQCLACKKVRYRLDEMENISIPVPIKRISETTDRTTEALTTSDGEIKQEFEPVTLRQCLDIFTSEETVDFTCPACQKKGGATKRSLFKTFPRILAVNARRFEIVNWLPTKQDVPVIVGDEKISLDEYMSAGLQEDEDILPEDRESSPSSAGFTPNAEALGMLEAMGFPRVRCEKALKATGNADAEAASNWLFEHMEDPDIDVPEPAAPTSTGAGSGVDTAQIEELGMMGFAAPLARQALKETSGNMERAVDWLFSHPDATGDFGNDEQETALQQGGQSARKLPGSAVRPAEFQLQSIVCHKGSSIHAGHYVAFIRKQLSTGPSGGSWTLFNDEKVVQAADAEEMKKFAYIYFFRRV